MANLVFTYAPMNSGKSTALLQLAHNYSFKGFYVILYTADIENRFGEGIIGSRIGIKSNCFQFNKDTDFINEITMNCLIKNNTVILVDESQFLSEKQVRQLFVLAHKNNIQVFCYGIRSDINGQPFSGSSYLLALADEINSIRSVCKCGKQATMHLKINQSKQLAEYVCDFINGESSVQIDIGAEDKYDIVCSDCFLNQKQ